MSRFVEFTSSKIVREMFWNLFRIIFWKKFFQFTLYFRTFVEPIGS